MAYNVYESCLEFKRKYPLTIGWRLKKHCKVIEEHINKDEVVLFTFFGQKNASLTSPFYTTVVTFTNKRMLLGRKRFFGRYYYISITPDMLNDFTLRNGFFFGSVHVDTVKENFAMTCLSKKSLSVIEDAVSKYLVDEKLKLLKRKESN